jgi:hypothetical protein
MKNIISILTVIVVVLAFGTAYGEVNSTLDPSKVPGYVDMETGAAILPAQPLFVAHGSAAGGMGTETDILLNYIDPSTVPGHVDLGFREFKASGSAAGGIGMVDDTLLNYIEPRE